jgi:hypothetical protein
MKQQFHYATITEALTQLKAMGYTLDFTIHNDNFTAEGKSYPAADFEIVDLYRYEGASDPADETIVYALASSAGVKGVLVSAYGASTDEAASEALKNLHYKYQQAK